MPEPFINGEYLLVKSPGKGGWTYTMLPPLPDSMRSRLGWVKVSGHIDAYQVVNFNLFSMKDGRLFMAIKAGIRKVIGKEAGDHVKLVLYLDAEEARMAIPDDFMACLEDEPAALRNFRKLAAKEQQEVVDWIFAVQTDEKRVARIAQAIDLLVTGLKPV